jgi:NRPS condensation-like uncharacterized protein
VRTTPLNVLDQHFLPWDQVEPLCILCELRVQGRLIPECVVPAVRTAVSHHPMARSCRATFRGPHLGQYWAIADDLQDIPLAIEDCTVDGVLDDARSRLLSRSLDLRSAPPFALMLAHRTGGDSLSLSLSHVVGDGMSALRLMRSIACAYAGVEGAIAGPDPLTVRDLSFYNGGPSSVERVKELLRVIRRRRDRRPESPTSRFATEGGQQGVHDAGFRSFCLLRLDRDETAAVMAQRRAPATISDMLIASLAIAVRRWNYAHGLAPDRINVQTAVNLRESEWFTEVISNLAREANIAVAEAAQRSLVSAQLAVADQTRAIKRRRARAEIPLLSPLNVVPRSLRYPIAQRLQRRPNVTYTVGLSNLGSVDTLPDLAHDAGRVTELWFAPPGTAALGTLAGTLTLDGEMFIALHYRRTELDRAAAQTFARIWREVLLGRS